MGKRCLLFSLLWIIFYSCNFSNSIDEHCSVGHNPTKVEAFVSRNITLECPCTSSNFGKRWKHSSKVLYLGENLQDDDFPGNPHLVSPYSLTIESVDFRHEGNYSCFCNFTDIIKEYQLLVRDLYLTINGSLITKETLHLEMDKQQTLACHVNGSNSDGSLKLMKNSQKVKPNISKEGENGFVAKVVTQLEGEEENVSCTWISKLCLARHEIQVQFVIYASPHLYLKLNGSQNKETSLYLHERQNLHVECKATNARPAVNLTLFINDRPAATAADSSSQRNNLYNTIVSENIVLKDEHIRITCVTNGRYGFSEKFVEVNVTTYASSTLHLSVNDEQVENGTIYNNNGNSLLLFSCNAYGARPAVKIGWNKSGSYEASSQELEPSQSVTKMRNSSFNTKSTLQLRSVGGKVKVTCFTLSDPGIPQQRYGVEVFTQGPSNALTALIAVCSSVILVLVLVCFVKKTKELLLEYRLRTTRQFSDVSEDRTEDTKADESCLTPCKVTFLSRLPGEGTMQYWKAVSSYSLMGDEMFVAKTVSETAPLKELYRFRDMAKEVNSLKKHSNVINTIGIAIENVPYYIYQEYIGYGSLRDYLLRNYQQTRRSQICSSTTEGESHKEIERKWKLTGFAHGVSEGMSFLAMNNFCHPALTSRKVLLTKTLTCKLYDFVPQRMAEDKLYNVMQQVNTPLAWLPPETIFLRQYSAKADVWSLAVLLWEIYSLGDTPHAGMTNEEIEKEIRSGRCLLQPLCCPGGIFCVMLSAWDVESEKRPTFENFAKQIAKVRDCLNQEYENEKLAAVKEDPSYFTLNDSDYDYVETQTASTDSL
ncbi:Tyrosine-protein kinase transmembrane receptor Ror [Holothuria leucospilota]|uniref:Tyrosine-protein kinase transmembrane receptor Ror n=1 Tax=Holothuria leucospilota TaxID=206669 RepID=A0A9Q1CTH3_HOLLE|nr:Tyrosine-protein kinase transmembrane receptor Ror [Holothuria leucospilota]